MDVILTDPHLDTRIKICILMNVIVPKVTVCRSMGREREVRKTTGNSEDDSSYKDTRMFKQRQDGDTNSFYVVYERSVTSAQMLEVSLLGVGTVLHLKGMRG